MTLNEAEIFAAPIVSEYLSKNNFDRSKILDAQPVIGVLMDVRGEKTWTVEFYIPGLLPEDALVLVSVDINAVTNEYNIIPGNSKELEKYKKMK